MKGLSRKEAVLKGILSYHGYRYKVRGKKREKGSKRQKYKKTKLLKTKNKIKIKTHPHTYFRGSEININKFRIDKGGIKFMAVIWENKTYFKNQNNRCKEYKNWEQL